MRFLTGVPRLVEAAVGRIPAGLLSRIAASCGPVRGLLAAAGVTGAEGWPGGEPGAGSGIHVEVEARAISEAQAGLSSLGEGGRDETAEDEEVSLEEALSRTLYHLGEAAEYLAGILDMAEELDERSRDDLLDACRYFAEVRDFLSEN